MFFTKLKNCKVLIKIQIALWVCCVALLQESQKTGGGDRKVGSAGFQSRSSELLGDGKVIKLIGIDDTTTSKSINKLNLLCMSLQGHRPFTLVSDGIGTTMMKSQKIKLELSNKTCSLNGT